MLTIKGFDRAALLIAAISLATPYLLPYPGSAIQRASQTFVRRHTIPNNVVQKMQREGNFRIFLQALRDTGIAYALETGNGPYTVFAPNDRAFASLSKDAFTQLFKDKERLKIVLKHHIVPRSVESKDLKFDSLRTLSGDFLMTNVTPAKSITVAGAVVNKADMKCRNGVVHSIDAVVFPLTGMETLAMSEQTGVQQ